MSNNILKASNKEDTSVLNPMYVLNTEMSQVSIFTLIQNCEVLDFRCTHYAVAFLLPLQRVYAKCFILSLQLVFDCNTMLRVKPRCSYYLSSEYTLNALFFLSSSSFTVTRCYTSNLVLHFKVRKSLLFLHLSDFLRNINIPTNVAPVMYNE